MILAIVGTRRFGNPKGLIYAELIITEEIRSGDWSEFITGDPRYSNRAGVDMLVSGICARFGRGCTELAPKSRDWEGFKARNILIAESCDALLCIRDPGSSTYGSGWTADYADTLGKPVTRVTIS